MTKGDDDTAPPSNYHHGDLRNAALAAASIALDASGRGNLTMRSLAHTIGVSHAALYRHFASMDLLVDEVAARWLSALVDHTDDAPEQFITRYARMAISQPHLYRCAIECASNKQPQASTVMSQLRDHAAKLFGGAFPNDSPGQIVLRVMRVWGTLHGLVDLHRLGMIALPERQVVPYITRTALGVP
jgi:AcrR family transcriptional regulator